MKLIAITLSLLLISLSAQCQDFSSFKQLFKKVELPYTVPDGAYSEFPSEESESPSMGTTIDGALAAAFLDADEDSYDQHEAVALIEQPNYLGFLIFITSISMNDGKVSGTYYLYAMTKTGEYISSRVVGQTDSWQEDNLYITATTSAEIAMSYWAGDQKKMVINYTDVHIKDKIDGKYGMKKEVITTHFDLIEEDGKINDVTDKFE